MKDLIRYSLLMALFYFTGEQRLYAQETQEKREEKPTPSSAYSSASDPLEETPSSSFSKKEVIQEVKAQLATMATPALTALIGFCKKNTIQGEFVVDLTLEGKGKVLTVFMVSGGED